MLRYSLKNGFRLKSPDMALLKAFQYRKAFISALYEPLGEVPDLGVSLYLKVAIFRYYPPAPAKLWQRWQTCVVSL